MDEGVIDLTYLKEVSKGDEAFFKLMISIFLEQNPLEVQQLDDAVTTKNYAGIKATAHKLKSSTLFVGLDKIIRPDLVALEELGATGGDIETIKKLFSKVKEACARAWKELAPQKV
jgi:HPt (histidine-containing phosphotransfer) domain-containing protein